MAGKKDQPGTHQRVGNVDSGGESAKQSQKTCFVVMPISDTSAYPAGHFKRVYEYLIKPAVEKAGYDCKRADDVAATNMIVVDILNRIVEADLVVCDLSGQNPNVMFELGLRQAFDKPTVLLKDTETKTIFDISALRYTEYAHDLRYDNVEIGRVSIQKAIEATMAMAAHDINSLVKLIRVKPAELPAQQKISGDTSLLLNEITRISGRLDRMERSSRNARDLSSARAYLDARPRRAYLNPSDGLTWESYLVGSRGDVAGAVVGREGLRLGEVAGRTPRDGLLVKADSGELLKLSSEQLNDFLFYPPFYDSGTDLAG